MQQNDCKLLVVGFDGLDFELFKAHCRVDLDIVPLHSPVPVTGPAWTSIYTGDGVSTHKVRDCFGLPTFRRYARNEVLHKALWRARQLIGKLGLREPLQECRTYADTSSRYVWDTLGAGGVSVKLVNLPVAAPVRQVNGIHVAGWPIDRRARWHWPDSIGRLIPDDYAELSDIIQWFENPVVDRGKVHRRCLRELGAQRAKDRTRDTCHRLARFFLQLPAAQFQMVQFSFIDRLGHVFGISADTEEFCYDLVNSLTEELVAGVSPRGLLVVSDHGFQGQEHTDRACLGVGGSVRARLNLPAAYRADLLDVAPTIAGLFGLEHPCEGNDLGRGDLLEGGRKEADRQEREQIMARMRDIGYF